MMTNTTTSRTSLLFVWHLTLASTMLGQSVCSKVWIVENAEGDSIEKLWIPTAFIDSDNQIVMLSPNGTDEVPEVFMPPIEKAVSIQTVQGCFAAISMNGDVAVWGGDCEKLQPPEDLHDIANIQMGFEVIVAEKSNGDYVMWGDEATTSHFNSLPLNSSTELLRHGWSSRAVGFISNKGRSLTVCVGEQARREHDCDSSALCCYTLTFHHAVIQDFRFANHSDKLVILTSKNRVYHVKPFADDEGPMLDFYGLMKVSEHVEFVRQLESDDSFADCRGEYFLRDGDLYEIETGKLAKMPFGNGHVTHFEACTWHDMAVLEDGRVVIIRDPESEQLKNSKFHDTYRTLSKIREAAQGLRVFVPK